MIKAHCEQFFQVKHQKYNNLIKINTIKVLEIRRLYAYKGDILSCLKKCF